MPVPPLAQDEVARAVVDHIGDGVLAVDRERRIVAWNPALERLLGLPAAQALGRPVDPLLPPPLRAALPGALERALQGHATPGRRLNLKSGDGRRALELEVRPIGAPEAVKGALALLRDVTARVEIEETSSRQRHYDELTGLPNRALFHDRLRRGLASAEREGSMIAVLCIDLAGFRRLDDGLEDGDGDQVLIEIARRAENTLRKQDTVARIGPHELVVIQTGVKGFGASIGLARRLIERLAAPVRVGAEDLHGNASIGIALYPEDGTSPLQLLRHAHLALERAAADPQPSFQFFLPEMNERLRLRQELERDLRQALERDELQLHYQPQVELASGRVCGVEALLRWPHPERGMVPPNLFIPIAEATGLIVPIGRWVLLEACRQAVAWDRDGVPAVTMAVNLSPAQFVYPDLVVEVTNVLEATGLAPERLMLEITEGMLMRDTEAAGRAIERLREIGVAVAVDDFGAGHASLAYLKDFPLRQLKIDRSFVRDLGEEGDDVVIAQAMITLGHALGLRVLAEGVETAAQLECLRQLDCDEIQGFYLARPMPPADCAAVVGDGLAPRLAEARVALQQWPTRRRRARRGRGGTRRPAPAQGPDLVGGLG